MASLPAVVANENCPCAPLSTLVLLPPKGDCETVITCVPGVSTRGCPPCAAIVKLAEWAEAAADGGHDKAVPEGERPMAVAACAALAISPAVVSGIDELNCDVC